MTLKEWTLKELGEEGYQYICRKKTLGIMLFWICVYIVYFFSGKKRK